MPRLRPDTIITRAIDAAVQDRRDFAAAYGHEGPEATEARTLIPAMRALKGKRFETYTAAERETARLVLLYAEQWERSLVDANPGEPWATRARRAAVQYRTLRHAVWGRTQLEAFYAEATAVPLETLLKRGGR